MKRLALALGLLAPAAVWASSFDLNSLQNLNQGEFRQLSQDLGATLSYKPLEPADPLGIAGIDLGVAVSLTPLANVGAVREAVGGSTPYNTLPVPSVRVEKGLPANVDFGVMYSRIPSSNVNLWGGELKWAVLPGGIALPAVALRGSVTRVDGVSQLTFESYGADLMISKGFLNVTPYGGLGMVWTRSSTDGLPLSAEDLGQQKLFVGVDLNLGLCNLVAEADTTGGIKTYSAKLGFRF